LLTLTLFFLACLILKGQLVTSFLILKTSLTFIATNTCDLKFVSIGTSSKKISKLTDLELETAYEKMLAKLTFINEELIPQNDWEKAEALITDIDLDDADFVALTRYLKASLWTGDKPLYQGLKAKRFRTVYNMQDMIKLRKRLTRE